MRYSSAIAASTLVALMVGAGQPQAEAQFFKKKKNDANTTQTNGVLTKTKSGLQYQDTVIGKGPSPRPGSQVSVHYTGWLMNGTKFDSSVDRGQPFSFVLGAHQVIPGWDEGVATMKVGGTRILIIPPQLGYGAQGTPGGPIPPNATLKFQVQLLKVQ